MEVSRKKKKKGDKPLYVLKLRCFSRNCVLYTAETNEILTWLQKARVWCHGAVLLCLWLEMCDKDNLCSVCFIACVVVSRSSTCCWCATEQWWELLLPACSCVLEISRGCPYSFYSAMLQADSGAQCAFLCHCKPSAGCGRGSATDLPSAWSILITE